MNSDTYPIPTRTLRRRLAPDALANRILHSKLDPDFFRSFIDDTQRATRYQLVELILIHKHSLAACETILSQLALAHGTNTKMRAALLELSRIIESMPSDIIDKTLVRNA